MKVCLFLGGLFILSLMPDSFSAPPQSAAAKPDAVLVLEDAAGSMSLEDCLKVMVLSNPEIRLGTAGFQNAEGKTLGFRSILWPSAKVQGISTPPTFFIEVEQVLYDRSVMPRLELGRLTEAQARVTYQAAVARAFFQTRQWFAVVLARQKTIALLETYLERSGADLATARSLFEAGKLQQSDVSRLSVKINRIRLQLQEEKSLRQSALLELSRHVGRELPVATVLQGSLGEEVFPDAEAKVLVRHALEHRADYLHLRGLERESEQQILLSTRELYPRLSAGTKSTVQALSLGGSADLDISRNDSEPGAQRAGGNTQIPLSLYLSWTFFDGQRSQGLQTSEQARLVSHQVAREALERAIPGEISSTLAGLRGARENLETLIVGSASEQLRSVADLDYQAGRIRLSDKSEAEDLVLKRELEIIEARLSYSLQSAVLDFSLGSTVR
jgi:outer membrane protein TolC